MPLVRSGRPALRAGVVLVYGYDRSLLPHDWRESHPEAVRTYRQEERRVVKRADATVL